jgi:TolB-like protein
MVTNSNKLYQFWQELKRRKVIKVIAMYAGAAYVLIELANNVVDPLHLPEWIPTFVILLLVIGFPITIILSWIFDITPEGMKKTESIEEVPEQEPPPLPIKKGLKTSDAIIAVLFVAVCILLYPKIFSQKDFSELRGEDGRISVAVMPFENLTGESSNDVWQNGISEYLINDLASSAELSVVSTQVMQEILGMTNQVSTASISPAHARETAGKLNTTVYVSGNFIGYLSNTSILLNLISTENGELVWSSKVVGDLGTHYQEVLGNLAEILMNYLEISALEDKVGFDLSKAFTKSSEAYRQYINGLNALVISDFQRIFIDPGCGN